MKKYLNIKILDLWPVLSLLLISLILVLLNYTPNTYLSGWDTLHPEFDFWLNIKRTIFGVFRVEQGLGAVAAHSHMADLPRILFLYLSSFFLPQEYLRYFYIFINIIVGPIGMYYLLNKHLLKNASGNLNVIKIASFFGGLFYLLNYGTLQIFNVPFEMFTTLYAFIPFVFYFALNYLDNYDNKKIRIKNLFLFSVFIIFISPSAYASTLWYMFFGTFCLYIISYSLVNTKTHKHLFKNSIKLILITILLNLYWIFPSIYMLLNYAKEIQNANINLLFSEQAFLKNKEFGNLSSILLLKIFYFDWNIYNGKEFINLLNPYITHLKDIKVLTIGYTFGISIMLGVLFMIIKIKKQAVPFLILLIISLFFLINDNFPFSQIFKFFQENFPFTKEALRFPGNKILNIYVFLAAIFFSYFIVFVTERFKNKKNYLLIFSILLSFMFLYYNAPSLSGNFLNKLMRVDIPDKYFQLFDYLKTQNENTKVANLPINSPYGWVYYKWNNQTNLTQKSPSFQGAGFLYFGIKQPLLDRDFDRWSPYNEAYYKQMSYAVYKKDAELLQKVLEKYKIGYIFIDESVFDPLNSKESLFFTESKELIEKTELVKEIKKFEDITLYKLKINTDALIETNNTNINVNPKTKTLYADSAYSEYGNYITTKNSDGFINLKYPFRNLIGNQSRLLPNILKIDSEKISLNPSEKITNFTTDNFQTDLDITPSDILITKKLNNLEIAIYPNTPVFDNTPSSSPLKGTFNTASPSENLFLAINQTDVFNLNNLSENTPTLIGKMLLKNADNELSLFQPSSSIVIKDTLRLINPFFSGCGTNDYPPSINIGENNITLKSKDDVCIIIPYGFLPSNQNQNTNLLANLNININGNYKINSCLYDQETSSCITYKTPVKTNNTYTFTFALKTNQLQKRALKIFIEKDNSKEENIVLNNISSNYLPSTSDIFIAKNSLGDIFTNKVNLTFNKMFLPSSIVYNPGFEITTINKFDNDCKTPSVNAKKEITAIDNKNAIKYSSQLGAFCDHYSYPNLIHKLGYFLIIESKNKSGLPLTLCVTNYQTRKCDLYTQLLSKTEFKKEVFLIPPGNTDGIGYDINLENLGIEKSPAENYLASIQLIPIPYEFLTNMKQQEIKNLKRFDGQILNIQSINPLIMYFETNNKPLIASLNYSFEKGFKLYKINCTNILSCSLQSLITPILKQEEPQVLINNWKNGWIIDDCNADKCSYTVIFVPQYLEYFGLILIAVIFTILVFKYNKKSS